MTKVKHDGIDYNDRLQNILIDIEFLVPKFARNSRNAIADGRSNWPPINDTRRIESASKNQHITIIRQAFKITLVALEVSDMSMRRLSYVTTYLGIGVQGDLAGDLTFQPHARVP